MSRKTCFRGVSRVAPSLAWAVGIVLALASLSVFRSVTAFSAMRILPRSIMDSSKSLSGRETTNFPCRCQHSELRYSSDDENEPSSPRKKPIQLPKLSPIWPEYFPPNLRFPLTVSLGLALVASSLPSLPANAAGTDGDFAEGISSVTRSALGTSVRSTVVQSAKLVDAVDLRWERFSDSLRDQQKCDPRTNRRLFDNGIRSDGTPRGNPVLGALCEPVALEKLDERLVTVVLDEALDAAAYDTLVEGSSSSSNNPSLDRSSLRGMVDQTRTRLEPVFDRAVSDGGKSAKKALSSSPEASIDDQSKKRQRYNLEVFARVRAYSEALSKTSPTETSAKAKASYARQTGRQLDLVWGRNLLEKLAGPSGASYEFLSPFPKPDPDIPLPYEADRLTNALGAIETALGKLQAGGLIGHWEISIPEDDFGEVVTIAVDDDVCLGAQILAREENSSLTGSPVVAMVRSALEDRAKIPYAALDVFFIDPTTTKNELYNPTQLLVSLRNLGEEP
mmetsp:Transcript_8462/g.25053  ORF Transcript_8462/g.25053 Transcript_8462/m.25053 type:complete len:506 (+) Transcript_8462:5375-6892(+)